jgi:ERCC4-type nuclease
MVRTVAGKKPKNPTKRSDEPLVVPFTVVWDHRERGANYHFGGLRADSGDKYRPLVVRTLETHLVTGDYSIEGLEHLLAIERKTASDLFGTLAAGRERFAAEHERMRAMIAAGGFACVLIESDLESILLDPPVPSQLDPKTVHRTAISWPMRYHVPWVWAGSRDLAEITTFRTLEMYWRQYHHRKESDGQDESQEAVEAAPF